MIWHILSLSCSKRSVKSSLVTIYAVASVYYKNLIKSKEMRSLWRLPCVFAFKSLMINGIELFGGVTCICVCFFFIVVFCIKIQNR